MENMVKAIVERAIKNGFKFTKYERERIDGIYLDDSNSNVDVITIDIYTGFNGEHNTEELIPLHALLFDPEFMKAVYKSPFRLWEISRHVIGLALANKPYIQYLYDNMEVE
jgi:hypothetical protein